MKRRPRLQTKKMACSVLRWSGSRLSSKNIGSDSPGSAIAAQEPALHSAPARLALQQGIHSTQTRTTFDSTSPVSEIFLQINFSTTLIPTTKLTITLHGHQLSHQNRAILACQVLLSVILCQVRAQRCHPRAMDLLATLR